MTGTLSMVGSCGHSHEAHKLLLMCGCFSVLTHTHSRQTLGLYSGAAVLPVCGKSTIFQQKCQSLFLLTISSLILKLPIEYSWCWNFHTPFSIPRPRDGHQFPLGDFTLSCLPFQRLFFLMVAPEACGNSWVKDWIWAAAKTYTTAAAMLDPLIHCAGLRIELMLHQQCELLQSDS